ncbi:MULTISPECIES: cytochrome c oxidase subunit I [Aneurinibacillus]|uniref:Cytochrome c oxidase subunit 1 n=1 Tax=Aneurinibacillus thermoaerophilus TaxID=143495 RepID=A0A1G8CFZ3_ANETH|nr:MULTISPECIES: cytochrome c oxidase subunit I [Aneurinibacillus]AMA71870.1 cytochrome ubiquinol oxidase subunit I [Aneurinibacillus sp. XH2]MED0674146.1 cytochrome c oxidase subunit I [Aneurinibacillus thermoaerophilus]MED0680456.1 cytochrome c oxidase subunit I [Aneurinibacillus thermoaerophilus]MED0737287.1 cytochrome c oxidase subunit I [Aneurinibacillus thermoaerophilus]MED0758616.1 cytochrome c oxidase subunit I [Aneurinibacillus thermoaerophilus]
MGATATAAARKPSFVRDWLLTVDHKKIGIMYGVVGLLFFFLGGAAALVIRTELLTPGMPDVVPQADTFNQMFTMHGSIMIFLFMIPMLTAAFGNYLIPIMVGAHDMAFPRMNNLAFWLYVLGGVVFLSSFYFGMPDIGWTAYPPYSIESPGLGLDIWVTGVHILGLSSILGAINIIVTVFNMRAPGMTFNRLPLYVWSSLVTAFIQLFGTPALAGAITTLLFDRHFGTHFYDAAAGGDPMLYQHLFWFYSHPAVYIMVLPAMGIVSEIIPVFARKPIFGYHAIAYSSIAIGFLGFLVWAHHMFVAGMPLATGVPFMVTSMIIAVPSAIKIFNWLATLWRGSNVFTTPMLFVTLGFMGLFTIGGLSGIYLAAVPIDIHMHDSYFVVAHFHYVLFGGSMMAVLGGIFYWFPKITGRMYNEKLGKTVFWLYFIGTNLTFFPMHYIGMMGMPRRVFQYDPAAGMQVANQIATFGSYLIGIAAIMMVVTIIVSLRIGAKAPANPWGAQTLEWTVSSPPPEHNFIEMPYVTAAPYEFGEVEEKYTSKKSFGA